MLKNINPTELTTWKKLKENFENDKRTLKTRFFEDPERFSKYNIKWDGILFDYSKNIFGSETFALFQELLDEAGVRKALETGNHGDPSLPVTDDTPLEAAE